MIHGARQVQEGQASGHEGPWPMECTYRHQTEVACVKNSDRPSMFSSISHFLHAAAKVEEAVEGYQRLQIAAAAEYTENVLQLPMPRRDSIGKLAAALKLRMNVGAVSVCFCSCMDAVPARLHKYALDAVFACVLHTCALGAVFTPVHYICVLTDWMLFRSFTPPKKVWVSTA